jgi:hypothetical protein
MSPLPLPAEAQSFLEQYRIRLRRRRRPTGETGAYDVRRRGDSLDFREYVQYHPGDDIRHIDWRLSLRPHGPRMALPSDAWLARRFEAEEQIRLVISVDTRVTMTLPESFSKLQAAGWLAEAIATVALRSDFQVVVHRLFGDPGLRSARLKGRGALSRLPGALQDVLVAVDDQDASLNIKGLSPYLPPASVWLLITDLYVGPEQLQQLAVRCREATAGRRWVILVEMDSWPAERALLKDKLWKVQLPSRSDGIELMANSDTLTQIEQRISRHRQRVAELAQTSLISYERWSLPSDSQPAAQPWTWLRVQMVDSQALGTLFAGDRW